MTYFYILAAQPVNEIPTFFWTTVDADNESHAYDEGYNWAMQDPDAAKCRGHWINDLVVPTLALPTADINTIIEDAFKSGDHKHGLQTIFKLIQPIKA